MTDRELVELAVRLRAAQRQYFKTRDHGDLDVSKRLEREFDKEAAHISTGQGSLLT